MKEGGRKGGREGGRASAVGCGTYLCRANIAGGLLFLDVLLSGLKAEPVSRQTILVPDKHMHIQTHKTQIPPTTCKKEIMPRSLTTNQVFPAIRPGMCLMGRRSSLMAKKAAWGPPQPTEIQQQVYTGN